MIRFPRDDDDAQPLRISHAVPLWSDLDWCYHQACAARSDIHEHLPLLRALAEDHERPMTVVEMGVRAVVSTWAFLAARPLHVTSVDVERHPNVDVALAVAEAAGVSFKFELADTLAMAPVACDLLFVDTLHTYAQLRAELRRHAVTVQRFIALHDTETFGDRGENGERPGLRQAVRDFQQAEGRGWRTALDLVNCNGLMVLERW